MIKILIAFLLSFVFSLILMPFIIKFFKRKQASQTILGYVENHKDKNGTLTMGGVVFMITIPILAFALLRFNPTWLMVVAVSVFMGVLGLMDDYLKIKYKQNLGLRPYQKIIGQFGIAIIFALYIYFFSGIKGQVFVPFLETKIDLGLFVIPLVLLVIIATTNSVNLTDGLDGLASSTTIFYLIFFGLIAGLIYNNLYTQGETGAILQNIQDVNILSSLFIGAVLAFLIFNTSKASIFMGDAGSLCLGGFVGASACVLGMEFLVPILGFCFLFSSLSVILQVAAFRLKKRRIFKMAPFHHHLQIVGLSEPKIVAIYSAVTVCMGVVSIIFYLL